MLGEKGIEKLGQQLLADAEEGCAKVLQGEIDSYENPFLSPSHYREILLELGCEHLDGEGETNGWQHDYWEYFEYEGKRFCQSGSGHYGNSRFCPDKP